MTNQPKPAPTAEEQPEFPPLDDTQKERDNSLAMMPDNPKAALYRAMCTCRERQLLAALVERDAALRSNREKDAQLANLEDVLESMKELDKSRNPCGHLACYGFTDNGGKTGFCTLCELAEKDAKIAELKQRCNTFMRGLEAEEKDCEALHVQLESASAQLRAVSEALHEYCHSYLVPAGVIAALFARLRSIVDGK